MFSLCISILVIIRLVACAAVPPLLTVRVTTPEVVNDIRQLWAEAVVTNTGSINLSINPLGTILSSIPSDDFIVDGSEASGASDEPAFVGAVGKAITDASKLVAKGVLINLSPGDYRVVNTSLAHRYDFASSGAGVYTISVSPTFSILSNDGQSFRTIKASTISSKVTLTGKLSPTWSSSSSTPRLSKSTMSSGNHDDRSTSIDQRAVKPSVITTYGCYDQQLTSVKLASKNAQTGSQAALTYLKRSGMDPAYKTWFGAANNARLETVKSHYSRMNKRFTSTGYDCTCDDEGLYAYTYPDDPTWIYICPEFWNVANCGLDSKQGTLVHEMSHFDVVAATEDYVYGQSGSQRLAKTNPIQAIGNADNHEYYEESIFKTCALT